MTRSATQKGSHIRLATLAAAMLIALDACNPDSRVAPIREPTFSAQADEHGALVVDNDGADCPHADFSSIQAAVLAAQPGDKILVCRGVYMETVLVETSDLRIEAQGAADDVVLRATATQPYGFHLRNTTGVLLQGFTVEGYADANIILEGGSGNTLRKNVATAGLFDGIEVKNSSGNLIEHNSSFENAGPASDGIFVWSGASENVFRHNETFNNGQHGINLAGSGTGNVVFGNQSHHNRIRGIQSAQQSNGTLIENNHVFANGLVPVPSVPGVGVGISALNSADVTIRNNRSENNGTNGIGLNTTSRSVVSNNRTESNGVIGIAVNGSSDNLVENNEVFRNGQDGIRVLTNSDRNIVRLNHVLEHSRDGIRVQDAASDGNTIEGNVIRQSDEHDAHDDSFGAGTGGTANFWFRNHCKTENRTGLCDSPVTPQ